MEPRPTEPLSLALDRWCAAGRGLVVALTGAGISAESGIPTFRGPEGYWTVGSRNYRPQDFATNAAFRRMPEEVWGFYLARVARHRDAEPNDGHRALVRLERALGDRFLLVTQNVDGLHARAGSTPERTYRIHGDLGAVRCFAECGFGVRPFPDALRSVGTDTDPFDDRTLAALHCPLCGGWLRPHVLWFDEFYDEAHFHFDSTLRAAERAGLLLVVGTSGATNLPNQLVQVAHARGLPIVVVGPDDSPFSVIAEASPFCAFERGTAVAALPGIVDAIIAREGGR